MSDAAGAEPLREELEELSSAKSMASELESDVKGVIDRQQHKYKAQPQRFG